MAGGDCSYTTPSCLGLFISSLGSSTMSSVISGHKLSPKRSLTIAMTHASNLFHRGITGKNLVNLHLGDDEVMTDVDWQALNPHHFNYISRLPEVFFDN